MSSSSPRSPLDDGEIGDDESKEFDDGYDENLMGDEADKKKLAQMTEKEREQELFERSERRETLRIRFEIERKLRSKAKKREQEKKQNKQVRARKRLRASEIYSSDGSSDDSDEYTPDTDKSSALNDVSSSGKPGPKMNTRSSSALVISSSSASASSVSSSDNSASESDERENDDVGADDNSQTIRDDFQMTLIDLKSLQLKRDTIEQWVYTPFFKETAIGLFVKISIGQKNLFEHIYKVAQIVDITKGSSIYTISDRNNRTDKQCLVRIGGIERTYKLSFISNRSFDEDDHLKWSEQIRIDGYGMPTREHFNKKKRDLHKAIHYVYKEDDIRYEVQERNRFKDSPYNFVLKKTELMGEKAEALAAGDNDRACEIQKMIDELEEKAKQLEKTRSSSTFSAISFVNERNRMKNIEESERVLKESKTVKTEDPFTRRKCTPTIVHNKNSNGDLSKLNDKSGQETSNDKTKITKSATATTTTNSNTNGNQKSNPEVVKSVDDLFQAHASIDLELDIDI